MSLRIEKITDKALLQEAFAIRDQVFVQEQHVDPTMERDVFETSSHQFIALQNGLAVGTARWRVTDFGVKLERFAVLPEMRGKGIGQALITAVLQDIKADPEASDKIKYLHAQLPAVGLYEKFGFVKVGDMFEECEIEHFKMQLK